MQALYLPLSRVSGLLDPAGETARWTRRRSATTVSFRAEGAECDRPLGAESALHLAPRPSTTEELSKTKCNSNTRMSSNTDGGEVIRVSSKGQATIPKELRKRFGIEAPGKVLVHE